MLVHHSVDLQEVPPDAFTEKNIMVEFSLLSSIKVDNTYETLNIEKSWYLIW